MRPTIFWAIKQISKDVKALEKCRSCSLESIRLDLNKIKNTGKISKHLEIKQYTSENSLASLVVQGLRIRLAVQGTPV